MNADAVRLVGLLSARGETVATCESLTAGLAAATIAEVPGASAVLRGGLVTYAMELKEQLAGVDKDLLDRYGPVSMQAAAAMAAGARRRCGSDWAVALTGVAGPEPQDGHPVGEVYLGVADPTGTVATTRAHLAGRMRRSVPPDAVAAVDVFDGGRAQIRAWSVTAALRWLTAMVDRKT